VNAEPMQRILLTGMSGTGKSSLIGRLASLGYRAVDVDDAGWTERAPDGGWVWQEDRVERFLTESELDCAVLFISGCAESQVRFYPLFDHIILLSAPAEVLLERLRLRTDNPYGKEPAERDEVLAYLRTVEPLLREAADHELDATRPLDEVLATVLRLAGQPPAPASR
jgi:shikimate kinase